MVRGYERLGVANLHDVLDAIRSGRPFEYEGIACSTMSNRLLTYHVYGVGCCVAHCPVVGKYFAVEKTLNQVSSKWHLNLYGLRNGVEVMMTSDHRIPKSRGGSNLISNRQPMCYTHNFEKGNRLIYT